MAAPILLLTHGEDFHAPELVADALRKRGQAALRLDTDLFPSAVGVEAYAGKDGVQLFLSDAEERFDLGEVPAVWYRRLSPGWIPGGASDAAPARSSARRFFLDVLGLLSGVRWVNGLTETERAENKLLQQREAVAVGLDTPDTLVTNHPDALQAFHRRLQARMITKPVEPRVQSMGAHPGFAYTTEVLEEHLETLDRIRLSPQIFQMLVPKRCELRVIVVGDRTFVGSIDTRGSATGSLDRRRISADEGIVWTEGEIPKEVRAQLLALVRRLGLVYAAIDVILDEGGRYVFLELNPAGEWGWLERDLGFPIADAIAETLLGEDPG